MNEPSTSAASPASNNVPQETSVVPPPPPQSTSIVFGAQLSAMAIGIVVLGALFCLALAIVILLVYRRKKQRRRTGHFTGTSDGDQGRRPSFKERIKDHLLSWQRAGEKNTEPPPIDDLVFSTIQRLPPKPPPPPAPLPPQPPFLHPYSKYPTADHSNNNNDDDDDNSSLYATCAKSTGTHAAPPPTADELMILQSLARQREFDRAGYFVNPKNRSSVADRLEEEAMLQHLSMSTYHVW